MTDSNNLTPVGDKTGGVRVALALVERYGHWLVNRRLSGDALEGLWEFPGGRFKAGESAGEAAVRECAEETGVIVDAIIEGTPVGHGYSATLVTLLPVFCRWIRGEGVSRESKVGEVRWVPAEALATLAMPAANVAIVEQILRRAGRRSIETGDAG